MTLPQNPVILELDGKILLKFQPTGNFNDQNSSRFENTTVQLLIESFLWIKSSVNTMEKIACQNFVEKLNVN